METKHMIYLGIFVGSTAGGALGALFGGGELGAWAILFSTIGAFAGIWAGYKAAQYIS